MWGIHGAYMISTPRKDKVPCTPACLVSPPNIFWLLRKEMHVISSLIGGWTPTWMGYIFNYPLAFSLLIHPDFQRRTGNIKYRDAQEVNDWPKNPSHLFPPKCTRSYSLKHTQESWKIHSSDFWKHLNGCSCGNLKLKMTYFVTFNEISQAWLKSRQISLYAHHGSPSFQKNVVCSRAFESWLFSFPHWRFHKLMTTT